MAKLAIGMDVGSTTVKAVVVDPATKEILWSDYQRHHTKQPEYVLSMLEPILAAFPDHRDGDWRMFLTGSGAAPLCAPDRRQVRPGGQRRHPRGRAPAPRRRHRSSSSAGRTPRSSCSRQRREDRRQDRHRVDERQVRLRHGRHHRQVLPQGQRPARARDQPPLRRHEAAPRRRQVRRLRRDRHRQPDQERHPLERGPLLARRRHRPAEPQRAHARRHAQAPGAPARRPEHLPAVPAGVLAPAHPADVGRARLRRTRRTCRSRRPSSSPRTRSTTPRSARSSTACTRTAHVGVLHADSTGLDEYITTRPQGAPRRDRGPAARRRPRTSSTSSASSTRIPKFEPATLRARARSCAPSSASTAARRRARPSSSTTRRARSSPRPTSSPRATRSRTRRSSSRSSATTSRSTRRPSSRSWASARRATPPTCSRSASRAT